MLSAPDPRIGRAGRFGVMSDEMCDAPVGRDWLCARPADHAGPHRSTYHEDEWPTERHAHMPSMPGGSLFGAILAGQQRLREHSKPLSRFEGTSEQGPDDA